MKTIPISVRGFAMTLVLASLSRAQVNVTTYHNDNARTGQNTQETTLTASTVNSSAFGKLFQVSVDGQVYAQPLVVSNVSIGGGIHNVVYVATEHDSVYAFDAANGTQYWKISFLKSGVTTVSTNDLNNNSCQNISPEVGITGTPVIDPASGTLYVVVKTTENNGATFVQRLHALSITTGADTLTPAVISATGFDALHELNRPGLLLENGHVIIAFGSHCDWTPYYGFVMSYNAATLALEAVFNDDPDGPGKNAGIWMSGGGVAADTSGNLYLSTGNGDYGPNVTSPVDFGCTILKLSAPTSGMLPVDWFTPYNQQNLCAGQADTDVGSGGVLLLPDQPSGYTYKHLLVQMGKDGTLYLLNRDGMGRFCNGCSSDTNIVQEIDQATVGVWGSPAFWNNNVYFGSANDHGGADHVKAFSLYTTTPLLEFTSQTPETFGFSTPTASVSANSNTNGILWLLDNGSNPNCCAVLHAYDATNLATELYQSNSIPSRDQAAGAVKFSVPTIANSRVYVGGSGQLTAYGPLSLMTIQRPTNDVQFGIPCYPSGAMIPSPTAVPYAYDNTGDSTSSVVDATKGGGSNIPECFGRKIAGWASAAGTYTYLRLVVDFSCGPIGSITGCAAFYSTNGGSTWNLIYETTANLGRTTAAVVLPPSQDLTQLWVGVSASGETFSCCNYREYANFWVYDIRTEGTK